MLACTKGGLNVRILSSSLALLAMAACAGTPDQSDSAATPGSSRLAAATPTPEQDRELVDAYMALSRSTAGNTGGVEEKAYAIDENETDPFKMMKWKRLFF